MDQALLVYLLTLIFTLDHMWIFRMCFITVDLCLMFHSVLKLFSSFHLLWFQLLRNQKQNHKLGINLPVALRLNHRHLKVINIVVALKCQGDNCVSVQYEKKQKQKWEPIHTFLFAGQSVLGQMVSGNLPLWFSTVVYTEHDILAAITARCRKLCLCHTSTWNIPLLRFMRIISFVFNTVKKQSNLANSSQL